MVRIGNPELCRKKTFSNNIFSFILVLWLDRSCISPKNALILAYMKTHGFWSRRNKKGSCCSGLSVMETLGREKKMTEREYDGKLYPKEYKYGAHY